MAPRVGIWLKLAWQKKYKAILVSKTDRTRLFTVEKEREREKVIRENLILLRELIREKENKYIYIFIYSIFV